VLSDQTMARFGLSTYACNRRLTLQDDSTPAFIRHATSAAYYESTMLRNGERGTKQRRAGRFSLSPDGRTGRPMMCPIHAFDRRYANRLTLQWIDRMCRCHHYRRLIRS